MTSKVSMSKAQAYQEAVIAVNRFGLGARPGELEEAASNPRAWLLNQMKAPQFDTQTINTESAFRQYSSLRANRAKRNKLQNDMQNSMKSRLKSNMQAGDQKQSANAMSTPSMFSNKKSKAAGGMTNYSKLMRQTKKQLLTENMWQSVNTADSFSMRLLDFFSNHFSVSMSTVQLNVLAPLLEREAIAPHLFGRFEDMLVAVIKHPAMLIYLDNTRSMGPNSKVGLKRKKRGLNENLAREILELHTLGIDGGYRIGDIQTLAKAISGWSVSSPKEAQQKGFVYRKDFHEPGQRRMFGKKYNERRATQQGERILRDLARHPSTALFVSRKLAQYFISDNPSDALVNSMEKKWKTTNGDLRAVIITLVEHDDSWQTERQKFKTPREFMVSSLRAIDAKPDAPRYFFQGIINHLTEMGQAPFKSGSPAGYSTYAEAWAGSDALIKRIDWLNKLNSVTPKLNDTVLALSQQLFGDTVSESTLLTIQRAESARQARTLLLMSPEFQRR